MSQSELRFYLDENMDPEIAEQLVQHGIDALSARGENMLRKDDPEQLRRAAELGRVICTYDRDFTYPEFFRTEHFGIAYFPPGRIGISYAVRALRDLHRNETAEAMRNRMVYL